MNQHTRDQIGRDPAWGSLGPGFEEPEEEHIILTETAGTTCPLCGDDIQHELNTKYPFLITGDPTDLSPLQDIIRCGSCKARLHVTPLVTLDFEIRGPA